MTVCVAVKVHDCIVFAADSASTLQSKSPDGTTQVLNVYQHADKVFNLRRDLPIAAMTCGMGHIGGRSISNLAKELRYELTMGQDRLNENDYTIEEVAGRAHAFFGERYKDANGDPSPGDYLEFWLGGYGSSNTVGEAWKVVIQDGTLLDPMQVFTPEQPQGLAWGGQGTAIARLVLGVDPELPNLLQQAGVNAETAAAVFQTARSVSETILVHATMPTMDAIRIAGFFVDITKSFFSFSFGSDIVGGPTDLATVTKWEGFKWVQRKHYYPANLNQGDPNHVC